MSKNRKRVVKGAKSVAIRTKHKIGGRKSGQGVKQMSTSVLIVGKERLREGIKVRRELRLRGIAVLQS